jgi:bacterioferritin-associated ferredoxin
MYVCICAAVKSSEIDEELHNGATLKELQSKLGVARGCCICLDSIKAMLTDKYVDEATPETNS